MDLNTQSLLYAICREYAKKIDKASAFIWLHYKMFPDGCDIKMINKYFEALNYWLVPLIYDGVLLKWLQQVGEEEGMALVKQIEISKDRSETAQATIKRLLLELDLLN